MEYQVPDPLDQGLFRKSGGIVSLSQTEDTIASAFADKSIALFSTTNSLTNLEHLISISLDDHWHRYQVSYIISEYE